MRRVRALTWLALQALSACAGNASAEPVCRRLVESTPAAWVDTLPPVLALGPSAAPALERVLREHPDAPGRQAVLCALGAAGNRGVVPFLIEQLDANGTDAYVYEAALSLGRLGDPRARAPLQALATDPARDVTDRAAAACALLDVGATTDALPLLSAVLLAGTPDGAALGTEHSLPNRSRWALERELCIDAIARYTGGETFGLHADSPWPALAQGVAAFRAHAEQRAAGGR